MIYEGYIFPEYFTPFDKYTDPNKDQEDKGTHERFCETIGKSIDDYMSPLMDNLLNNVVVPKTALDRYIPFQEKDAGYLDEWRWFYLQPLSFRRALVQVLRQLYKIRGTVRAYEVLFGMVGLSVTVTQVVVTDTNTFDSGEFDAGTFDSPCSGCYHYKLELTGSGGITSNQLLSIGTFILFNNPMNGIIDEVTYNGSTVLWQSINVNVTTDGDLEYENILDPETFLSLLPDGDLQVTGTNENNYSLNDQGDLIWQ